MRALIIPAIAWTLAAGVHAVAEQSPRIDLEARAKLEQAILAGTEQAVDAIPLTSDEFIARVLASWRVGDVWVWQPDGGETRVVLVENPASAVTGTTVIAVKTGEQIVDAEGRPILLRSADAKPADTTSRIRRAIKRYLDVVNLAHADWRIRRDAASKLGAEQKLEHLELLKSRLALESHRLVRRSVEEAVAMIELAHGDAATRQSAARRLGELRSQAARDRLVEISKNPADPAADEARKSVQDIDSHARMNLLIGTAFRGLSLASVLLIAALGLAVTFGLMGIINMAHGEMIMVGAYVSYVAQRQFAAMFGPNHPAFGWYVPFSVVAAFFTTAAVGLLIERGIIRFLYRRPLESLLATWGISLFLQQTFRSIFGAANVQVAAPAWLLGSFEWMDVIFSYTRLFVIAVALLTVLAVWFWLNRSPAGLFVRSTTQNRAMAECLGVRSDRVDMLTFAVGSGLAGIAGACLAQIGNVGPSLGQAHIIDCFMIVVLGGVGNLVGTILVSLGLGVADQIMQPFLGAVLGKIILLFAIIVFLQWKPAGLFPAKTRNLDS
ncbi:MAG: urea ABC transporter permease subunit UrtB [Kiritimatiellae bacterium]|nr:urea ABC transporter permease subunit UrtB [Kiritimatiellia bacterium]MDW8459365.1 urea ABC transporter permease subunit UrtB [Verrucomicrobiota bacterium]